MYNADVVRDSSVLAKISKPASSGSPHMVSDDEAMSKSKIYFPDSSDVRQIIVR